MEVWVAAGRFEAYGVSHLAALVVALLGLWPAVVLGRRTRAAGTDVASSRAFAVLIACVTIAMQVVDFLPGNYNRYSTWPLQLCDFAWLAAVWALWTRHWLPVALTYFWGLVLTTQAMLTPALAADFPHPKYFGFWLMHQLIVWAAVYLVWGLGERPRWRSYRATVLVTAVWAVAVFSVNSALGTNYGFLNRKPATASVLDLLGPWPWYVVVEIAILLAVWALMTWPWVRASEAAPRDPAPPPARNQ